MKHKEYIQMLFKSAAIVCLVLGYASCVDDAEVSSLHKNQFSDVVTFGFGTSNEWTPDVIGESGSFRARSLALPMDCEDGELPNGEIYMYMLEEDAPTVVDTVSIDSRANGSEEPVIGIFAYQVPGVDSDTKPTYDPTAEKVSVFMNNVNSSDYAQSAEKKYWPGGGSWLQFYGYKPYCDSETSVAGLSLSTVGNNPTFTYSVPTAVGSQSDLMVAATDMLHGTHCKKIELQLQHILSKVQVKVGNIPSGTVKSISFENIYCNATYSFVTGSWELTVKDEKKEKNNYIQESPITDVDSKIIGEPFHFLPQELSEDAKIKIVLSVITADPNSSDENATRTKEYTVSKKIKDFKDTWAKDKQYTYVITTPQQVDVEVSDKVEGRVKKDLVIKNTGLSPAYIRAAIIGNWVQFTEKEVDDAVSGQDGKEIIEKKIVSKWNETEYGTFDWGHGGNEHVSVTIGEPIQNPLPTCWVRCSDGYFYYTQLVQPGEELKVGNHPLFASYTLTSAPDMADIALELIIAVQAVYPDDLELLWKEEIADILLSKQSN